MKAIIIVLILLCTGFAQDTMIVDVHHFPPCVKAHNGTIKGFDIEIFETVAHEMGLEYRYNNVENFADVLQRVKEKKSDVGIAGITVTSEREKYLDFSHPYLKSGLNILVQKDHKPSNLKIVMRYFDETWRAIVTLVVFVLLCSLLIWFLERGKPSFDDRFFQGSGDGIYWTNTTMTTVGYGDKTPMTIQGKIFAMIVMWVGICVIFPYFTARMGHALNTVYGDYEIVYKDDLEDKRVAVVEGTTAEESVQKIHAFVRPEKHIGDCYKALREGRVDAVVYDMPPLRELVKQDDHFAITGPLFDEQDYGFAFPQGSPLRERFNIALLKLLQSKKYKEIYDRWLEQS